MTIFGSLTGGFAPNPSWNQTDETKPDYIIGHEAVDAAIASAKAAAAAAEEKKLQFVNTVVAASAFQKDATTENFPFRAKVLLEGVTGDMIPEVFFSVADASSGNFAAAAESAAGGIYIYAADAPEADVTIPVILCWKGAAV